MIKQQIEKEIKQDNKFAGSPLTLHQFICLCAGAVASIVTLFLIGSDNPFAMYICIVYAGIAVAFGWFKPGGIPFYLFCVKKIKSFLYHNNIRHYKCKNAYIPLINQVYKHRRQVDMADKKIAKTIKKEQKQKKKKNSEKGAIL